MLQKDLVQGIVDEMGEHYEAPAPHSRRSLSLDDSKIAFTCDVTFIYRLYGPLNPPFQPGHLVWVSN